MLFMIGVVVVVLVLLYLILLTTLEATRRFVLNEGSHGDLCLSNPILNHRFVAEKLKFHGYRLVLIFSKGWNSLMSRLFLLISPILLKVFRVCFQIILPSTFSSVVWFEPITFLAPTYLILVEHWLSQIAYHVNIDVTSVSHYLLGLLVHDTNFVTLVFLSVYGGHLFVRFGSTCRSLLHGLAWSCQFSFQSEFSGVVDGWRRRTQ